MRTLIQTREPTSKIEEGPAISNLKAALTSRKESRPLNKVKIPSNHHQTNAKRPPTNAISNRHPCHQISLLLLKDIIRENAQHLKDIIQENAQKDSILLSLKYTLGKGPNPNPNERDL